MLLGDRPAVGNQALANIVARFFERGGRRRPRAEIDQRLDMSERVRAGKFQPRLPVSAGATATGQAKKSEPEDTKKKRSGPAS
jgi:hypothetical protein